MGGGWPSARGRALAGVGVGVLSRFVPPGLVDEVVAEAREMAAGEIAAGCGRPGGQRFRALPGRVSAYFVLGLCLYSHLPYAAVVRELASGLGQALRAAGWRVPASTALTQARRRLGEKPLELLFWRLCSALSPVPAPWSHICGLLAVAWDGTTVKAAATPENIAAFGKPGSRRGKAAYPQLRLVTLVACGTRALVAAAAGPLSTGEQALAAQLPGCLRPGMLLIADRGFYSWRLWRSAAGSGADLLWRVQSSMRLPVVRALPDGSYLSVISDPAAVKARMHRNGKRRRRGSRLPPDTGPLPGITVRVIEFTVTVTTGDGAPRTEPYRLITTLHDHRAAPAADLAAGYARRWAIETGFREFKTYLRGPGRVLRGRTPDLARQELWAYLAIYQAIRALICAAAASAGLDPDRISFTTALHAVRRTLTAARTRPAAALAETETDLLTTLVPERHGRICLRAVHEPAKPFPSRHSRTTPLTQHATHTVTIRQSDQPPPAPATQPQQPRNHHNQPP
jgi:hypothetical protein